MDAAFDLDKKSVYLTLLGVGKFSLFQQGAIQITQQSGNITQVPSTIAGLRDALQGAINNNDLITTLTITGHGNSMLIQLNPDELITSGHNMQGNTIILDNWGDITDLMNQAIDPNAEVNLQGCHTGSGVDSFAQEMSRALPGRIVAGGKRYLARISKNTGLGSYRYFRNGAEQ